MTSREGTSAITRLLRIMNQKPFVSSYRGAAIVNATVNGKLLIEEESFDVLLMHDGTNLAHVDVFWEDGGYKAYRAIGLYGSMSTKYQKISFVEPSGLSIKGDTYRVDLQYEVLKNY